MISTTITGLGFEINSYYICVIKKNIEGMQCTIVWYVDDNKLSHTNLAGISDMIKIKIKHFDDLKVWRGKTHTFLGLDI